MVEPESSNAAQETPPNAAESGSVVPAPLTTEAEVLSVAASKLRLPRILDWVLLLVLVAAAYFRLNGLYWGEYQYLHPDERFLVWVGSDISPARTETTLNPDGSVGEKKIWIGWSEFFDTPNSTMNPNNRGHGFYVYGTLPMFITRLAVEWVYGHSGFNEMTDIGRALSAVADLLVIILIYAIGSRQYDRRVAALAAALYAAMALPIQQAHFFTMDTFINLFTLLALYFAVRISSDQRSWEITPDNFEITPKPNSLRRIWQTVSRHPLFIPSLGFGLAYGMAVASKLNAAPVALALPLAVLIRIAGLPRSQRSQAATRAILYLALAGFLSILVFRICQPYAFSGPGFFGLKPNPQWVANLKELRSQSSGDVDFPPAMQWARRDVWFSGQNMILWGMGIPLGILAWTGFLWVGLRMLYHHKNLEWRRHALLWSWTGLYFTWQSLALNPTMRYQLPIYPTLAIFAGWAVVALWDTAKGGSLRQRISPGVLRSAAIITGGVVLLATYGYAFGFSSIYTRPITRVAASRWIFENIAAPINLRIETEAGRVNQLVPISYDYPVSPGYPLLATFQARASGVLNEIYIPHLRDNQPGEYARTLRLTLKVPTDPQAVLASATLTTNLTPQTDSRGNPYTLQLDAPLELIEGQLYSIELSVDGTPDQVAVDGDIHLAVESTAGSGEIQALATDGFMLLSNQPFATELLPSQDGYLTNLTIDQISVLSSGSSPLTLAVSITTPEGLIPGEESMDTSQRNSPLATVVGSVNLDTTSTLPVNYQIPMDVPLPVTAGQSYRVQVFLISQQPILQLAGDSLANEGEWDDGLPMRMDGYDPFGGIYPQGLNFNMYWDDDDAKLERFIRILDESDYIAISSNRQWGSLPRIPERFPLTTTYYRELLGCPEDQTIYWCYAVAEPDMFQGNLGFELVKIFQSNPKLGPFELNDQFAEEAFTVYDHPKVLIFKKTADYDYTQMAGILSAIDLSRVLRIAPMRFPDRPADLMLSTERQAEQRSDGTWTELFNPQSLLNRSQPLAVLVWYLSFSLLGWAIFPILRHLLPGLPDGGYALARTTGLLVFAYLAWLAGSIGLSYSRLVIALIYLLLLVAGLIMAVKDRRSLSHEFKQNWRYLLIVELLALAFFSVDLLIRFGNPDLWHPWKGGERPMDFSYFNAILKSTAFPPYDPWFAGGYLNYYYFGFVFLGTLVKLLGITPAVGYNLILPTVFSMLGLGAFGVVYNLVESWRRGRPQDRTDWTASRSISPWFSILSGLLGAVGLAVIGNLGTVRMIFQGYQRLAAPGGVIEDAAILTRWVWAVRGFFMSLAGESLPYALGDWYWLPSRAIPAPGDVEPITEFPFFTVIFGDPHAHLFALPITLLVLGWCLAMVVGQLRWRSWLAALGSLLIGGLAIGALRPTNTWDFYPYLALGALAVAYPLAVHFQLPEWVARRFPPLLELPVSIQRILVAALGALGLILVAHLLYQPYAYWYGLGYSEIDLWEGTRTPLTAYFTHWLVFLFPIVTWMFWETVQWMAATPLSALRRLEPYKNWVITGALLLLALIFITMALGAGFAWLVLPLAAWAGVLILRPGLPDVKRFLLFLVGAGLLLTLMVEIIVLVGDIGRMNTVFKFYLQVWTFFSLIAAAALGWLWLALPTWKPSWRSFFQFSMLVLLSGAALYPLMAGMAKIKDRMAPAAPHTLDSMAYMEYATYGERWGEMDLSQDYDAIQWLLYNVQGSPVIVEANLRDLYRWGSRMSVYTGLPGVTGWEWHQQQQRNVLPANWVSERIAEIDEFYLTTDDAVAQRFLEKYNVAYIILGQQERGLYTLFAEQRGQYGGLDKFSALDGILWRTVYQEGETIIYEVIDQASP